MYVYIYIYIYKMLESAVYGAFPENSVTKSCAERVYGQSTN